MFATLKMTEPRWGPSRPPNGKWLDQRTDRVRLGECSTLLLLWFLDNPYRGGLGGMRPVAMERTVQVLSRETGFADGSFDIPCDSNGVELT